MSKRVSVTVLGSTGTIGVNTLDVIARHPDAYEVFALTGNTNIERLVEQCCRLRPRYAAVLEEKSACRLRERLSREGLASIEVLSGTEGLVQLASHEDVNYVMAAIVGAAGLIPTLAAAKAGKRVLLANKEALVMAGQMFMDTVRTHSATLLPIDSEHNAIWQCMPHPGQSLTAGLQGGVTRILLTASGGPFRNWPIDKLHDVTPDQACAHPNWKMGRKISVDSATMMNKGLEVIEACWIFNASPDSIEVVLHPESVVHSMVEYEDGSILAQLGNPDMRTPIAHALAWPSRMASGVEPLDIFKVAQLNFEKPDFSRFPCLRLAYKAIEVGGTATAILNAANEQAVAGFLDRKIRFTDIADTVSATLDAMDVRRADTLETVLEADRCARRVADEYMAKLN
ncbi:MAG TPA: 1-deoxy-D-xylulose-5-phosphate reductoisomerase [Gammaproteobacteria bacterium]